MTTGSRIYMETVSLYDEQDPAHTTSPHSNAMDDDLEGQLPLITPSTMSVAKHANDSNLMDDMEDEEERGDNNETHEVVVVVEHGSNTAPTRPSPPTLPPLRMMERQKEYEESERDYVDTSLFSPEVTRHSLEQAHRRARALEGELRELEALEAIHHPSPAATNHAVKITPLEAVTIISTAFTGSLSKVKQLMGKQGVQYDLLGGSSPLNKCDDLDTDGDGLQLSPDASRGADGKHFMHSPKTKPALKRVSVYSTLGKDHSGSRQLPQQQRRRLQWHDDVLDHDEEFVEDQEEEEEEGGEGESLMVNGGNGNGNGARQSRQSTPRSKKKRKKMMRSIMRRLTPREKEVLYQQRPDLMIVPNWAQKYREEMTESESTRWSFWLMVIIGSLATLLLILIVLIARDKSRGT